MHFLWRSTCLEEVGKCVSVPCVTGHRCSIPRASYCELWPRRTFPKFNSMVLIQFLRSLVGLNAVWKSLIRAFKRYRGREENIKSDRERMVWTFECRFVDHVFVWWTGCSRPVTSDSSKADFWEAVSKPFILNNKHVSWRFGEDFPSALSCEARLFFFLCLEQ